MANKKQQTTNRQTTATATPTKDQNHLRNCLANSSGQNRRWNGRPTSQGKKQTNHSRTNADVAVAVADVAVAVSKWNRRAPIPRQAAWPGRAGLATRMQLCIIYGNQFRVNINTAAMQKATKHCRKLNDGGSPAFNKKWKTQRKKEISMAIETASHPSTINLFSST